MSNSFTNQTIAQIELFTKNDEYEKQVYVLPEAPRREGRPAAPRRARRQAHRAAPRAGRLPRRPRRGPVQVRPLPVLGPRPASDADDRRPGPGRRGPGPHRVGRRADAGPALDRASASPPSARSTASRSAPACTSPPRPRTWSARCAPAGAEVALCAPNPLSTQDDVAAALVADGVEVHAVNGEDMDAWAAHVVAVAAGEPQITLDDGADLVTALHARGHAADRRHRGDHHRARAPARARGRRRARVPGHRRQRGVHRARLQRPPRHRASRRSTASSAPPTCCSPGARSSCSATAGPARASRCAPRGSARQVVVCEVDPLRALEARMDGFEVMPALEAAERGDVFVTVTGAPRRARRASTSSG